MRKNRISSITNNTSGVTLYIAETEHPFFGPLWRALQCKGLPLKKKKRNRRIRAVEQGIRRSVEQKTGIIEKYVEPLI
jgi:hypothetical protein